MSRLPRLRRRKKDEPQEDLAGVGDEVAVDDSSPDPAGSQDEPPARDAEREREGGAGGVIDMPSQEPKRRRRPRLRRPRRPVDQPGPPRRFLARLGGALGAVGTGLTAAGSYLAEVGRELWLAIGDVASGIGAMWRGVDVYLRRRIALGALAVVAVVAVLLLAVPALPCQYPGGDVCPPPDDAAKLVPSDALGYVHIDTDTSSDQYQTAAAIATRIPLLAREFAGRLVKLLPATGAATASFSEDVRPWLGDEAALALLPAAGRPQEIELLSVASTGGAESYQTKLAGPGSETIPYRGVSLVRGRSGVTSAIVGGFLVVGTTAGTEAAIDVETRAQGTGSLSDSPAAKIRDELPAQRVADAYFSPAGAATIAGRPTGLLSSLAPFFAPRATDGVAMGVVAHSEGLDLEIRSALDPQRVAARPGFFAAFPEFEPSLASKLPAKTLAYIGIGHAGRAVSSLLAQASTEEPGLTRALTKAVASARRASGLHLSSDLLTALGTEGAVALEPAPSGGAPYALYLGAGINPEQARAELARLARPLARALGSTGPGPPKFRSTNVAGVAVQTLDVSPALQLSYAVVGADLVVATNPIGVAAVAHGGLSDSDNYSAATSGLETPSSLLGYLDLRGLAALAEQAGLATDPAYATFAPDVHQLKAFGISVRATPRELDTDSRLVVGSGSLQSRPPTNGDNEPSPKAFR